MKLGTLAPHDPVGRSCLHISHLLFSVFLVRGRMRPLFQEMRFWEQPGSRGRFRFHHVRGIMLTLMIIDVPSLWRWPRRGL